MVLVHIFIALKIIIQMSHYKYDDKCQISFAFKMEHAEPFADECIVICRPS
jgi:hypothetical protein